MFGLIEPQEIADSLCFTCVAILTPWLGESNLVSKIYPAEASNGYWIDMRACNATDFLLQFLVTEPSEEHPEEVADSVIFICEKFYLPNYAQKQGIGTKVIQSISELVEAYSLSGDVVFEDNSPKVRTGVTVWDKVFSKFPNLKAHKNWTTMF